MKLKLNLDKKTILDFLLQNVEKIVLGVIVLVMLLMLYSAFRGAGRFDRTPKQLEDAVDNGKKEIERTSEDSAGLVVADYASQAKQSRADIKEQPYGHLSPWDKPLFDKRPLRDTPPLLAVQKLRGAGGVGAFRTPPAAARQPERRTRPGGGLDGPASGRATAVGDTLTGERWVVVTGLVPIEKQEAAYADTLRQSVSYDPQNDHPSYLRYWVERVEISSEDDAANPDWKKAKEFVSKDEMDKAFEKWPQSGTKDVVSNVYIDDKLTFPLGPLVNQTWGPDVAYPDEIPLLKSSSRGAGMGMEEFGGRPGQRGRTPRDMMGPMEGGLGGERNMRAEDDPFEEKTKEERPKDSRKEPTADRRFGEEEKALEYKLFRFFDFSVEPGKQYVYRVRMALRNPNRDLKTALLKKPELATEKYLTTKWSDPTPAIVVPRDTRVLAVSVVPARSSIDSTSTILATKWLKTKGIEAFVEKSKIGRGQLCDFPRERFRPPRHARAGGGEMGIVGTSTREMTVDFITGATVVDLRGGERLPGKKGVSAGEILVLDTNGTLSVRNELDDFATYEQLTGAGAEPAADEGRGLGEGMMGPEMMGPEMMGPGGGLDAFPADRRKGR